MIDNIQQVIEDHIAGSPNGMSAVFIKLTDGWGIKMFRTEEERDFCYTIQKNCASKDWGPEVGDKVNLPEPVIKEGKSAYRDSEFQYGYVTEMLEVLPNLCLDNAHVYREKHGDEAYAEASDIVQDWCERYKTPDELGESQHYKWIEQIKKDTGYYFGDNHEFNWGKNKEGKWVPIDFGAFSEA